MPYEIKILLTKLYAYLRLCRHPTSGYLEFSYFPFNSAQPLSPGALDSLSAVSDSLHQRGILAFISDGTLLGLVRDGGLIPHDNDLDFVVLGLDHHRAITKIMKNLGLKLASLSRLGSHVYHMSFFNQAQHIIDFTIFEDAGATFVSFRDSESYFVIPKDLVADLAWLKAGRAKLWVPARSEDFLALQYGESWKTPTSRKDDWKASFYGIRRANPLGGRATLSLRREVISQLSH